MADRVRNRPLLHLPLIIDYVMYTYGFFACTRILHTSARFKGKNDHRSKFSNLTNWKEEA